MAYLAQDLVIAQGADKRLSANLFNFGNTSPSRKNFANHL